MRHPMSEQINPNRRRFLGASAMSFAVAEFAMAGFANASDADSAPSSSPPPGTSTSFGPLKQVMTGVLNIGYAELGPASGPVVMLLHGWPYDIHSYVDVAPLLAS